MAITTKIPRLNFYTTDLSPSITARLDKSDGSGTLDISGATAQCLVRAMGATSNLFSGSSADATNAGSGSVQYTLPTGGFATAGIYFAQFKVTFSGGNTQRTQRFQIKVEDGL